MLKILELVLSILLIILAFIMVMFSIVVFEVLSYIHAANYPIWLETMLIMLLPYIIFRLGYFFISRYKYVRFYG